jgi:hypothetical protein
MPLDFRILSQIGVVFVRYWGRADLTETMAMFEDYMRHPDYRPGQRHIVDTSGVTEVDTNYARLMAVQARVTDTFEPEAPEAMVVYFAPHELGLRMARLVTQSWQGNGQAVILTAETEAQALGLLGLKVDSFAALLAAVD